MLFAPYDLELQQRAKQQRPIRVGLVGAGNLARMIATQLLSPPAPGIVLAAVANRSPGRAVVLLQELGTASIAVDTSSAVEAAIGTGRVAVVEDSRLLSEAGSIDVIVEATGSIDSALSTVLAAITGRKAVVLANAELDSLLGPLLHAKAKRAGVVYTNIDGDEPGVAMNLYRYARSLGLRPVAAGNLKGMVDRYRTPETQRKFAEQHGQNPTIVTSFADGTKLAMELCILSNATGFKVGRPGMYGPACSSVMEIARLLPAEQMLNTGLVDYALGAAPYTGAFVVVHEPVPARQKYLQYLKMGDGPFYVLYTPYHLPHIQIVSTIGRAVICGDETVAPLPIPSCEVIAHTKKETSAGSILDGPGGFACYGQIENFQAGNLSERGLPIALAQQCVLKQGVPKDHRLLLSDIAWEKSSPAVQLWQEMQRSLASLNPL